MYAVTRKLKLLKPIFRAMRRKKGDITENVTQAKEFLRLTQSLLQENRHNDIILQLECVARIVLLKAMKIEQSGDAKSNAKGVSNSDVQGTLLTDEATIEAEFIRFYEELLGGMRQDSHVNIGYLRPWARHIITHEEGESLIRTVTREEIKTALFDIDEDKAQGPDGFSSSFFKAAWPVIGNELTRAVQDFFITGKLLKQVNATLLALIPKVAAPQGVTDFRSIACCNVVYKIITKVIVQRMQPVMGKLFVNGLLNVSLRQRSPSPLTGTERILSWSTGPSTGGPYVSLSVCTCHGGFTDATYAKDDLLLFSKADEGSLHIFRECLRIFSEWSGLTANVQKSQLIVYKAAGALKQRLLQILGFQEGALPVRVVRVGVSKVAWKDVCKPREEGGQGIRALQPLNRALMSQHFWAILQHHENSIWVTWVHAYRLRRTTVWTANPNGGSWCWRKILRLCNQFLSHVRYHVGVDSKIRVWEDPCTDWGSHSCVSSGTTSDRDTT
ncbi:UNVERIFIED_CONTAM: hypothetical protein Slati_2211700 [Sesamum latifolium]|uniref:Reverse transcriptase domain-containing protein n=1 Tax=Sesamum latifolium TaxID=2727402 RepID=A0AAW2WTW5_9LAMI